MLTTISSNLLDWKKESMWTIIIIMFIIVEWAKQNYKSDAP